MKIVKVKPGNAALSSGIIDFAVPATNASPLDLARLATGGKLRETDFCLQRKPGQFRVPPCIPPPELFRLVVNLNTSAINPS